MTATDPTADIRSAKGRRTRARLMKAGRAVFARDGFVKARIADIAIEAGLSYGAFYHYFESKDALFREIAEETEVALLSINISNRFKANDPIGRIREANRTYLESYRSHAGILRVIEEVSRYDDEVRSVRDRVRGEFAARIGAAIRRLQDTGAADPDVDPRYAAMALGGMVHSFAAALFVDGAPYELEPAVEQLTLLWANALGVTHLEGVARASGD